MKLPRFTVLRLMILVMVAGLTLALIGTVHRRSIRFGAMYDLYRSRYLATLRILDPRRLPSLRRVEYLEAMLVKYDRAARHPWLPVEADPPEPKD